MFPFTSIALRTTPGRRSAGFSLVELITVIGIIGILIALLMPTINSSRERANQLKCLATLRSIGQAAELHVATHNGFLPAAGHHWEPTGGRLDPAGLDDRDARRYTYFIDDCIRRPVPITVAFALAMGHPVRTESRATLESELQRADFQALFRWPSQAEVPPGISQAEDRPGWGSPNEYSSYIFNEAVMGRREVRPGRSKPIMGHITKVRRPSMVFLAADGLPRKPGPNWLMIPNGSDHDTTFIETVSWGSAAARSHFDLPRHGYRMNVLFLDGHAESSLLTDDALDGIGLSAGIYD